MAIEKLSARRIDAAKPGEKPLCDGGGLWLWTQGGKSWVFRYKLRGRKGQYLGLGSFADVSAAEARAKARQLRALVHRNPEDGGPVDVLEVRREAATKQRTAVAKVMTFRGEAELYLADNEADWKNAKHRQQWKNTLATYVYPELGDWPIRDINKAMVVKVLSPIWKTKCETARRVRMRIEAIIDRAIAHDHYKGDNPAKREIMKQLLGKQQDVVKHMEALHYKRIGEFMLRLRQHQGSGALPLEFAILTTARAGDVQGALWEEIDLKGDRTWVVPAARRKGELGSDKVVDLVVPLSERCMEILKMLEPLGTTGLVFRGNKGRRLSENTLLSTLAQLKCEVTTHGFRSTFQDWRGDCTNYPRELGEMALGHKVGDGVEQCYRRGTAVEKRRQMMQAWAKFIETPWVEPEGNVTPIGAARA
jgi:integrase